MHEIFVYTTFVSLSALNMFQSRLGYFQAFSLSVRILLCKTNQIIIFHSIFLTHHLLSVHSQKLFSLYFVAYQQSPKIES